MKRIVTAKTKDTSLEIPKANILASLEANNVAILPPMDILDSFTFLKKVGFHATVTMIDPWYNKGVGGVREDYIEYIVNILNNAKDVSLHIYLWGFPEIVARFVERIPKPLGLVAWLTWYYKNSPSVIKGWRSSQIACLHLAHPKAKLYPEHFLNEVQKEKLAQGKLRYMPGPTSVIEDSLLVGFVGRKEQTGHPAQKPVGVYEKLFLMVTREDDVVFDLMAGSGTTGEIAKKLELKAILCDCSEEYTQIMEKRLEIARISFKELFKYKSRPISRKPKLSEWLLECSK